MRHRKHVATDSNRALKYPFQSAPSLNRRGNAREFIEKRRGVSDLTSALSSLLPYTSGFSLRLKSTQYDTP
jgi:hypothetical protein